MAFGLGGLVALAGAGKFPQALQDYEALQAERDEKQRDALSMAAMGNAMQIYANTPSTGQGGMPPGPVPNYSSSTPTTPAWPSG